MNAEQNIDIIKAMIAKVEETKDELTELDNAIGDGDHGINLARGFQAVGEKIDALAAMDVGAQMKAVGMTLVSTVGGASGPLYGTGFMKLGAALKGQTEVSDEDFIRAFGSMIEGIKMRGKSTAGEKTMLDALCPAYDALSEAHGEGRELKECLAHAVEAAKKGVEYTKTIPATKGRASYLGERSIGHQDPGATSALYLMEAIASAL
ncbi:dihydroxyacetone kinase subunit DhaL [Selenomonas sp. TAMA-11512]|uniref:dihydroxyacetone kinase subunit DhaL n=1 Tax=Selenomonas sp. TAMA-11512 TaxID=3095337 RepID=UPI0030874A56|nr:dihydroxyacetone kinase subunit DhaL [Selenomonas sp. TAMA-11512]